MKERNTVRNKRILCVVLTAGLAVFVAHAYAASFDCAKAGSKIERLICDNPDISKLDEELSVAYKNTLADPTRADATRQAQKQWLKDRNACPDSACVKVAYRKRVAALSVVETPAAGDNAKYGFKGEFILSRNEYQNPICQRFTQNLNQFRKLDFNVCHPRLSEKFPEFTRPKWEEIPFDLMLAEKLYKGAYINSDTAENHWVQWRDGSVAIRTSGQARMWRTRIDLDGDAKEETVIRMVPGFGIPVRAEVDPPWSCDYTKGSLHMMDNLHKEVSDSFNRAGASGPDIIYFAEDKHYYMVTWNSFGPAYPQIDIGATAGVEISRLSWSGSHIEGGNECLIDWVPTGKYKPLKRHR
jgi:uncharacterized protein